MKKCILRCVLFYVNLLVGMFGIWLIGIYLYWDATAGVAPTDGMMTVWLMISTVLSGALSLGMYFLEA